MSTRKEASSSISHLRGSFAAATGESRRKTSFRQISDIPPHGENAVPTSLEDLLKRAEVFTSAQSNNQEDTIQQQQQPLFTDATIDGEDSQFAFSNGVRFSDNASINIDENATMLQEEISVLQHALINRFRGPQKIVSGCQFRVSQPHKFMKCQDCENRDKALAKAKELIKKLKANQERSETTSLTKRPDDNEAYQRIVIERDALAKRCAQLNLDIQQLTAALNDRPVISDPALTPMSPGNTKRDFDIQIARLLEQNNKLSSVIQDLSDQKDAIEASNSSISSQLEEKSKQYSELQDLYSKHQQEYTKYVTKLNLHLLNLIFCTCYQTLVYQRVKCPKVATKK